ncbi:MAG TPA: class I SAM-dependent methyltransferase, partial [Candidatus Binatus sp.]|nr:class I SAM-dependent methyltransferase [Candidatus Binatus sp.]
ALMPSAIPFRTFWVMASEGAIAVPDLVTYVPVDFETESLADELERAGFDAREPAFFSWLGVTPYLRLGSVMATLRYVAAATRTGGGVVFDYAIAPRLLPPRRRAAFDALARRVSAAGEPWQTFFEPSSLVQDLRAMGFGRVVDFGPEELNARYFAGRADCLRLGGSARLMSASP